MSIIEKAFDKLSSAPGPSAHTAGVDALALNHPESLVEKATLKAQTSSVADSNASIPRASEPTLQPAVTQYQPINLAKLKKLGMLTPDDERSQIAEEFRLIKRPLVTNAFAQGAGQIKNGNLIMVTSSLPGEGKTFCAINLALSIAMEMGRTVLLVDADVARPRVLEIMGIEAERGLLDVLRDHKAQLSDVLIRTNIDNLTVLPAGQTYRRATELLASNAMNKLIEDIANRYPDRIIIFDSPPLLSTSEASVLATHMGQIVMVVEAERTPQDALKEALAQIESCEIIGMVLNKTTSLPGTDSYYGYYGNYGK